MNIFYNIRHRGKIALLLLALAGIVFYNSNTYNQNINEIGNSFSEVYSDRLLAQDYIYKLADNMHDRKLLLAHGDMQEINTVFTAPNTVIRALVANYEKTKLTTVEQQHFDAFKANVASNALLEKSIVNEGNAALKQKLLASYEMSLDKSLFHLDKLSEIQILEGKHLNDNSRKVVSLASILNQLDWFLIIAIGITIQGLVFATQSTISKLTRNPNLN